MSNILPGGPAVAPEESPAPQLPEVKASKPASLWSDAWHDLRRKPIFIISCCIIAVLVVMAIWPSLFSSVDPFNSRTCELATARQLPSAGHPFGRDNLG